MDAVLVGTNTIKADNPRLTPYLLKGKSVRCPVRVVLDRKLALGRSFRVFNDEAKTIVFTSKKSLRPSVYQVREKKGHLDIQEILKVLHSLGITSVMVEGGGEISASFLEAGVVDKVIMFVAPIILGGRQTVTSVEGKGITSVKRAIRLKEVNYSQVGEDLLIEGAVCSQE